MPSLNTIGSSLTAAQLSNIIEHGAGVSANPTHPYMPIWHGIVSNQQISDLVAYIHAGLPAVSGATPVAVPTDQGLVVAGQEIYVRNGCVNCHGPNGLGGVPNPASPDKTIPPLSGATFRGEFNTPKKIKDVIVSGSVLGACADRQHATLGRHPHPSRTERVGRIPDHPKMSTRCRDQRRIQVVISPLVRRYTVPEILRSGSAKPKTAKHSYRRP